MSRKRRRRRTAAPDSASPGESIPVRRDESPEELANPKPVPAGTGAQSAASRMPGKLTSRVWLERIAPVMVVLVALLVYGNALQNGFVLDDGPVVLRNPLVHSLDGLWRAFTEPYWPAPNPGGQYRPLGTVSFVLDWAISGGDPRWLHAANVIWHAAAAVLVWYLAIQLLAPAAALIAALLFAVHPVHVEAVANLVGRLEPMAAVFVLGALLAHRRRSWWAAAFFALGLLSKESAITFLGLAVAHDLLVAGDWRAAFRAARKRYAVYVLSTAAYASVVIAVFRGRNFGVMAPTFVDASTTERLLTVATIVPHYVRLLLAPIHLSGDYFPQVIILVTGVTPAGLIGFTLAVALGVAVRRAWRPVPEAAFALVWIPIAISPVSNVFFPSVALAERTLYLASVGACLALGVLAQRVARDRPSIVLVVAAMIVALGAARTWNRTPVWRSDKTYTIALLRDHPESYRAHLVAGRVLSAQHRFSEAAEHFEIAARLFPRDAAGAYEAAIASIRLGRITHADSLLQFARQSAPPEAAILLAHADVRYAMGDNAGAIRTAREALAIAPDSVRGLVTIAVAARRAGNLTVAETAMRDAVMIAPERWDFRAGYADLLLARGDSSAARAQADSAVALSHGNPAAIALRVRLGELTAPHSDN